MWEFQAILSFDCTLPKTIICHVGLNNLRDKKNKKTADRREVDPSMRK